MSFHFQKYRFSRTDKKAIDRGMSVVAVIHPLSALPQVMLIYMSQDASGVSLVTWLSFMLIGVIFLLYAIVHKIKPMIVTQILWFVIDFAVVIGTLMYR